MNKQFPMTRKGEIRLKEELNNLKSVERPRIINAIAEARAHGDLKENAEYHAAREEQSFIEARISSIEGKLSNCRVVDITTIENNGTVIFGSTVTLLKIENDSLVKYTIVGEDEAEIKQNKISFNSPIARAIIGKTEGDVVDVQTPSGIISYEIDSVEYV